MTDRTISLLVTLDKEYRTDDAEVIVNAIKMIKGVLDVNTVVKEHYDDMNAYSAKLQLKKWFYKKIEEVFKEF